MRDWRAPGTWIRAFTRRESNSSLRIAKQVNGIVAATYLYEILVLTGFSAAGYVVPAIVIAYALSSIAVSAIIALALHRGWSQRFKDPSLFLVQAFCATSLSLSLALVAPQIVIQPVGTWVAVSFFGLIAPNRKLYALSLLATLLSAAVAIVVAGPRFAVPTSTAAGQALTMAVMLGVVARCVSAANLVFMLRRRLSEKNKALRDALARIEILAQRDELTGLPNRRNLLQWLADQLAQSERTGQPLTIALLDIDRFKGINDEFGHPAGDRVLQIFAQRAQAAIRAADRLGRYGGEEFLVALVATPLTGAEDALQRIRSFVACTDWSVIDRRLRVSVTIGAASHRRGETIDELIKRADVALYRGKEGGRDIVVLEDRPFAVNLQGSNGASLSA